MQTPALSSPQHFHHPQKKPVPIKPWPILPFPHPWQLLTCFLSLWIGPCWIFHLNGITQRVTVCSGFFTLACFHVSPMFHGMFPNFTVLHSWIIVHCVDIAPLVSLVIGWWTACCFHLLTVANSAAVSMPVQVSVWIPVLKSLNISEDWNCWVMVLVIFKSDHVSLLLLKISNGFPPKIKTKTVTIPYKVHPSWSGSWTLSELIYCRPTWPQQIGLCRTLRCTRAPPPRLRTWLCCLDACSSLLPLFPLSLPK